MAGVPTRGPQLVREEKLLERGLAASPSLPNLLKPQLYREALARMGEDRPKRSKTALVIPDYAVRMAILDFEEFPDSEEERGALLRFRLRKSVPFHIEEAQLSYSIQMQKAGRVEVLTVVMARPILQEYEAIFQDAGFRVGLVMPSAIAALPLCETNEGGKQGITLLAKLSGPILSVLLIEQGRIRLIRCLDLAEEEADLPGEPTRAVMPLLQQTLAFAEDQLGQTVSKVLLCGFGAKTPAMREHLQREFSVPCAPVRSRFRTPVHEDEGMLGMLEQYA